MRKQPPTAHPGHPRLRKRQGGFPPRVYTWEFPSTSDITRSNHFSTHVALLPHLEQPALFNALNLHVRCVFLNELEHENFTAARTVVSTFLCPADPQARALGWAPNSYRGNVGVDPFFRDEQGGFNTTEEGAFIIMRRVLPVSDFRDGLSHTLAFSEKPVGSGAGSPYMPFRDWIHADSTVASADQWVEVCSNLTESRAANLPAGRTWVLAGAAYTHFFTILPPNSPIPDCGVVTDMGTGLFTARSYHGDGANAALADGSVRWYPASTATAVWRALGTRSGGEALQP